MADSIQIRTNRWLHRADFDRDPFGRADPAELIDDCWEQLESQAAEPLTPASSDRPLKATGKLVAARVRASAGVHSAADPELKRLIEQQQRIIRQQQGAIDRLLAFVPTRTRILEQSRLTEIVENVSKAVSHFFTGQEYTTTVSPETDEDTPACHRVVLEIVYASNFDSADFVERVAGLQRHMAETLSVEEFQSLRVFVEPRFADYGESG